MHKIYALKYLRYEKIDAILRASRPRQTPKSKLLVLYQVLVYGSDPRQRQTVFQVQYFLPPIVLLPLCVAFMNPTMFSTPLVFTRRCGRLYNPQPTSIWRRKV